MITKNDIARSNDYVGSVGMPLGTTEKKKKDKRYKSRV
jgi:hypothetical protein